MNSRPLPPSPAGAGARWTVIMRISSGWERGQSLRYAMHSSRIETSIDTSILSAKLRHSIDPRLQLYYSRYLGRPAWVSQSNSKFSWSSSLTSRLVPSLALSQSVFPYPKPAILQRSLTDISGGSGGVIYAYIFGWVGCFANFMVLSELASMCDVPSQST
jgi:hypothetical protein